MVLAMDMAMDMDTDMAMDMATERKNVWLHQIILIDHLLDYLA